VVRHADTIALQGLIAGSRLMFGAFIAKRFVLRLEPDVFRLVMDGIMLAAGLSMLALKQPMIALPSGTHVRS
jgi:uncharacterized membrane protein YfcA